MTTINLVVNGAPVQAEVEDRTHLADFLRESLHLTGTHLGCEHGVCGACTVLIDGQPVRSCSVFTTACDGAEIRTIEGFDNDPAMTRLRDAFHRHHGLQCGFCTPGMLVSAWDIVTRLPGADDRRIRAELSGNLCRCTGYMGIVAAIRSVLEAGTPSPTAPAATDHAPKSAPLPHFAVDEVLGPAVRSAAPAEERPGWVRVDQQFGVGFARDRVWSVLQDVPRLADCLPGAEVTAWNGRDVVGRVALGFGPIAVSFEGEGTVTFDPIRWCGTVEGRGRDGRSNSRAAAEISFALTEDGGTTTVRVSLAIQLGGALAQFGRSGLVRDFTAHVTREFAENLSALLEGNGIVPRRNFRLMGMIWAVMVARWQSWFARPRH